jgi:hypothetical protein
MLRAGAGFPQPSYKLAVKRIKSLRVSIVTVARVTHKASGSHSNMIQLRRSDISIGKV